VVVSHDVRASLRMASRLALLAQRHIVFCGTPKEMVESNDPYVCEFLGGL
jgi:phospholipid/cholesterol/gamma-HCH transport system ATP-binding protein